MRENLERLQNQVTGQPHTRNLQRWRELVNEEQLPVLRRVLTGMEKSSRAQESRKYAQVKKQVMELEERLKW